MESLSVHSEGKANDLEIFYKGWGKASEHHLRGSDGV